MQITSVGGSGIGAEFNSVPLPGPVAEAGAPFGVVLRRVGADGGDFVVERVVAFAPGDVVAGVDCAVVVVVAGDAGFGRCGRPEDGVGVEAVVGGGADDVAVGGDAERLARRRSRSRGRLSDGCRSMTLAAVPFQ